MRLLLLLLAATLSGCFCFAPTLCQEECEESGKCSVRSHSAGDHPYRCYAGDDDDCADSRACKELGDCFATEQGECVAEELVEWGLCRRSSACRKWGKCGSREGACWAESDEDCAASFECKTVGRCKATAGVCAPKSEADCKASTVCTVEGACSFVTFLGLGGRCMVLPEDKANCEASWICEHYGRCEPAHLEGATKGRYRHCAVPGEEAKAVECSRHAWNVPGCQKDGRCAHDADGDCAHAPVGGPPNYDVVATADSSDADAAAEEPMSPGDSLTADATTADAASDAEEPDAEKQPFVPPQGPGSVAYNLEIRGENYEGSLTWSNVLTGLKGFVPDGTINTFVLRTMPEETCRPRSRKPFLPLDAIWFIKDFPMEPGTHEVEGGYMPSQFNGKAWFWDGKLGGSENFGVTGSIVIESATSTMVRGRLELEATGYLDGKAMGTIAGEFEAPLVDCSAQKNWPM